MCVIVCVSMCVLFVFFLLIFYVFTLSGLRIVLYVFVCLCLHFSCIYCCVFYFLCFMGWMFLQYARFFDFMWFSTLYPVGLFQGEVFGFTFCVCVYLYLCMLLLLYIISIMFSLFNICTAKQHTSILGVLWKLAWVISVRTGFPPIYKSNICVVQCKHAV